LRSRLYYAIRKNTYFEKDSKRIWIHVVNKGFYLKTLRKDNEKICPTDADMPRVLPEPRTPTEEEKQAHRLTAHMLFAAWCPSCVKWNAKDAPHSKQGAHQEAQPIIQLDYHEFGGSNDGAHCNLKGLLAIDTTSGAILTVPVQKKGSSDRYAVESVCHWLKELGYPRIFIRSDNEPSIRDFVGKVVSVSNAKEDHLQIAQETSPRHSTHSNGAAERAIQTTNGILRTMKDDIETTVGQRFDVKHPVLAWMLRHTGWLTFPEACRKWAD
jgi:hypothetical protein